jgi:maltose-binding protein MalE
MAQEKLTVWWVKGFYKSEDDALFEAIKKYEAKSGVKVELSQYPIQDMIRRRSPRSTPARRPTSPTPTSTTSR